MERSLHRVSLGSRRAHPGLSFYLSTFGKCPRRPPPGAASLCWQRAERTTLTVTGEARSSHPSVLGHLLWPLPPVVAQEGLMARLGPSKPWGTTCCLATGAKCSWFCLAWLE